MSDTKVMISGPSNADILFSLDRTAPAPMRRADILAIIAILTLWGVLAVIADPVGDFPLNDDFAHALPVKWLVETGRFRFTDYQYTTLIAQVLWGALFTVVTGFSFTMLRISTLVIGAIGLVATYLAGRETGLPRWLAIAVTGLFVINPIFLAVSLSFHTDVHFWALAMLAVFLLLRGLRRGDAIAYWAGLVIALIAALVRQVGLAIPIGLTVALALRDGLKRSWLIRALVPTAVIFLVVVVIYPKWVQATIGLPLVYYSPQRRLMLVFTHLLHFQLGALKPLLYAIGCGLMHLGWWMLPLLLLLPKSWGVGDWKGWIVPILAAGCTVVVTSVLWKLGCLMPLGSPGIYLVDLGTGPRTLKGSVSGAPVFFWVAVTAISAFGATLLVLNLTSLLYRCLAQSRSTAGHRSLWLVAFLVTIGIVYYGPFGFYGPWFDRYLFPIMGLIGLLIAAMAVEATSHCPRPKAPWIAASAIFAVVYVVFSVVSAHDYLAWNRSRWEACRSLMSDRDGDIDGGYEFNGYYAFVDHPGGTSGARPDVARAKWPVDKSRARFAVSFSEQIGFFVVRRLPVNRWFPLSPAQILILERSTNPRAPTQHGLRHPGPRVKTPSVGPRTAARPLRRPITLSGG